MYHTQACLDAPLLPQLPSGEFIARVGHLEQRIPTLLPRTRSLNNDESIPIGNVLPNPMPPPTRINSAQGTETTEAGCPDATSQMKPDKRSSLHSRGSVMKTPCTGYKKNNRPFKDCARSFTRKILNYSTSINEKPNTDALKETQNIRKEMST
ncbi:uncharacterized protein MCYG_04161 [Microsporum canis CBS 113480]|uniref:Uncharacterized protein n=1 Tax=Arthroderma otae (strain ATCC MYA-4605 / CBS 113480) TaxID=554155 RepID=C5FNA6_ARTOC|nr:uncharacterized protein MCYG_04161 [Microsporum canis CBS 113480]EEQ31342.1 predicted protein [Microsporum canis CBS 113480]